MESMIIRQMTDLGKDAVDHPKKYNGFLGVSILHKFFKKQNMEYYFRWCSEYFNEFIILLMDDPDKYNFMVFKKMNEDEALEHTRKISSELRNGYEKTLKELNINNIKIVVFKDFINNTKYKSILKEINLFVNKNNKFKKDLSNLMEIGIGGKINDLSKILTNKKLLKMKNILFQYIIEELASIIYFTENHYPIELDPTIEFITKKRIYEGDFLGLYKKLKLTKRGHIFIHPKGIEKNSY